MVTLGRNGFLVLILDCTAVTLYRALLQIPSLDDHKGDIGLLTTRPRPEVPGDKHGRGTLIRDRSTLLLPLSSCKKRAELPASDSVSLNSCKAPLKLPSTAGWGEKVWEVDVRYTPCRD
jgi:hypothetical protein